MGMRERGGKEEEETGRGGATCSGHDRLVAKACFELLCPRPTWPSPTSATDIKHNSAGTTRNPEGRHGWGLGEGEGKVCCLVLKEVARFFSSLHTSHILGSFPTGGQDLWAQIVGVTFRVFPKRCDSQRKRLEEHRFSGYCGEANSHEMKHFGVVNMIRGIPMPWGIGEHLALTQIPDSSNNRVELPNVNMCHQGQFSTHACNF